MAGGAGAASGGRRPLESRCLGLSGPRIVARPWGVWLLSALSGSWGPRARRLSKVVTFQQEKLFQQEPLLWWWLKAHVEVSSSHNQKPLKTYRLLGHGIYTFKKSSDNCKIYNKIVRFNKSWTVSEWTKIKFKTRQSRSCTWGLLMLFPTRNWECRNWCQQR